MKSNGGAYLDSRGRDKEVGWGTQERADLYEQVKAFCSIEYKDLAATPESTVTAAEECMRRLAATLYKYPSTQLEQVTIGNTSDVVKDRINYWHGEKIKAAEAAERSRVRLVEDYLKSLKSLADAAEFLESAEQPDIPHRLYPVPSMPNLADMSDITLGNQRAKAVDAIRYANGRLADYDRYANAAKKLRGNLAGNPSKAATAMLDALASKANASIEAEQAIIDAIDAEIASRSERAERDKIAQDPVLAVQGMQRQIEDMQRQIEDMRDGIAPAAGD